MLDVGRGAVVEPVRAFRVNAQTRAVPDPSPVPSGKRRVLIAPLNFAGQGHAWAQAINENVAGAMATNLAAVRPGDFGFPAGNAVPHMVHRYHRRWQERELAHVAQHFTHVLVEAEAAVFGRLLRDDPELERMHLAKAGISVAYVCHGSDIRSPERHALTTPFSPFADSDAYNGRVQARVNRNYAFLKATGAPVFLSTPDLLNDYEDGIWLPIVVDVEAWSSGGDSGGPIDSAPGLDVPRVVHIPSRARVKGTHLVERQLQQLDADGTIQYFSVSGVPASEVRRLVQGSDIVADQFRLGSYGAAACEAMAAGKVVVGHVTAKVRDFVFAQTGLALPIVEADPGTIAAVLAALVDDPARMSRLASQGREFVARVHSGGWSAAVLERHWLN